jgi:hypothetical protein
MSEQNAKSLQKELFKVSWFVGISRSIQEWRRLQHIFQGQLDPDWRPYCQFNHYKNGCLLLAVQSGAWAARMRYLAPDLIKPLQVYPEFSELRTIKCQVEPSLFSSAKIRSTPKLSAKAAAMLANIRKYLNS